MGHSQGLRFCSWMVLLLIASTSVMSADEPAKPAPFVLNPKLIEQARRAAAVEMAKPRDLKQRRPKGLENLETPEDISRAVESAMSRLASKDLQDANLAYVQLSYLQDHAFSAIGVGAKSDDEAMAANCTALLGNRGDQARLLIEENLKSTSKRIGSTAVRSLTHLQNPKSIPVLIDALDHELIRYDVVHLLVRFHDPRAIEPIRKFGDQYRQELEWLQKEQHSAFKLCPPDQLPLRRVCQDAMGLAGESYGPREIQQILDCLDSKNHRSLADDAVRALHRLREPETVPFVIRTIEKYRQEVQNILDQMKESPQKTTREQREILETVRSVDSMLFSLLSALPTEEAVDFLVDGVQTPDRTMQNSSIGAVAQSRWGVPLLIGLLDDPKFTGKGHVVSGKYAEQFWNIKMPATHGIYVNLHHAFNRYGLRGPVARMTENRTRHLGDNFHIADEITRVKAWWEQYGDDFLQEKPVPNPNVIYVDDGLK